MPDTAADIWSALKQLPRPTLLELFSAKRDGGEGADEPGGQDRVAMLSGRIELAGEATDDPLAPGGILFDWSKTHLDSAILNTFAELAEVKDFAGMRAKLFAGEVVNPTEGRAADHATLRGVGDEAKVEEACALIDRMGMLVDAIHQGALGEVEHLIHIGIGGSALGPALGVDALAREFSALRRACRVEHRRAGAGSRLRQVRSRQDTHRGCQQNLHDDRDDDQCEQRTGVAARTMASPIRVAASWP